MLTTRSLVVLLMVVFAANASAASLAQEVAKGDTARVVKMLSHGVDANKPDHDGRLALDAAASRCDARMVGILLAGGASAKHGFPLCGAIQASQPDSAERLRVVEMLLAAGASPNVGSPLLDAVRARQDTIASRLLVAGAAPDSMTGRQDTALLAAIRRDNLAMVTMLLGNGATVDCDAINTKLEITRPLALAVTRGRPEIVQLLLERGAQPNQGTCDINYNYSISNGVVAKDMLTLTAKGTLALARSEEVRALLRSHGARESVKVEVGPGTHSWASKMFLGGGTASGQTTETSEKPRTTRVTSSYLYYSGTLDCVFLALFNDVMKQHGVPDSLINFFGK